MVLTDAFASAGERLARALPTQVDVVLSDCLLSQLMHLAWRTLGGRESPLLDEVRRGLALVHLRVIARALVHGGVGLVVSDVASRAHVDFSTFPLGADLRRAIVDIDRAGLLFPGTNPLVLRRLVRSDDALTARLHEIEVLPPWFWRLRGDRLYLVSGLRFKARLG